MSEKMTGKSKSMGRIIGKIALWLVIGGALGFFGAFLIFSIKGETENVMHLFFNGYLAYACGISLDFYCAGRHCCDALFQGRCAD